MSDLPETLNDELSDSELEEVSGGGGQERVYVRGRYEMELTPPPEMVKPIVDLTAHLPGHPNDK